MSNVNRGENIGLFKFIPEFISQLQLVGDFVHIMGQNVRLVWLHFQAIKLTLKSGKKSYKQNGQIVNNKNIHPNNATGYKSDDSCFDMAQRV